jgi:glycine cleavage system H lipoate-binding protein
MDNFYVDLFATKGLEYLLVIVFLVSLVLFWRFLQRPARSRAARPAGAGLPRVEWFGVAGNLYYHQGHAWALPETKDVVRIGMDDFAQRLLGKADAVELPSLGISLEQGEKGWHLKFGSRSVPLVSPVGGKVVEVNPDVLRSPGLINEDPYGAGWILKVRTQNLRANLRNLLSGNLVTSWMEETVRRLRSLISPTGMPVLQDGGTPVSGFARNLSPDRWDEVAREFLLTSEGTIP